MRMYLFYHIVNFTRPLRQFIQKSTSRILSSWGSKKGSLRFLVI